MATLADRVYDNGLTILDTEASRLDICSQEPTTYAEATSTHSLGNATSISISAPADRTGGGRKVTLSAVSGGAVSATGTATHFALTDVSNTRLLATGSLTASQAVTLGNSFATTALDIGIPDPA
ncbi:putative metalloprotease [uncultured Mediterranean phage uvMED]|nr:putative metalloprotease [uncultured Mediterranean phage uvMED]BAR19733.1 putative metalloprotease [uncultured Mediterranean phage uvMED]BAR19832.1 putative metalloprotease [uncultured Mediterranean phage uvMED]